MKIVLEQREIKEYPLVEREVAVDDNKLIVTFSLIDDLNLELSYYKTFPSCNDAVHSAKVFIECEKINIIDNVSYPDQESFSKQQITSKINLLEDIVNKNLNLPDGGDGFTYDGDFEYISVVLQRMKNGI
ncbi:hypothetical protein HAY47_004577 [Salmonella enterica]|nr:hypothetical protein [Salmonella enterica subsp. salamae]EEP0951934.1 hypothetical protein [Salmonella enterica]EEP0974874.1 hypothetical protein [Salmonella enterica]EEP1007135.1 hypothetical protein [Salmonella enterica]EEP1011794.1 hypothetical protein [Salmonella enterica]